MCVGLHVKYPLFLFDFNETWTLSTEFRKILKYQTSRKSVQSEPSCYMKTDERTDEHADRHDEANSRFSQNLRTRLKISISIQVFRIRCAKLQDVTAWVILSTNIITTFARLSIVALWRSFWSSKILRCLHSASGKHSYLTFILVHRLGRRGHQISRRFPPLGGTWRTLSTDKNCGQDNSCSKLFSSLAI